MNRHKITPSFTLNSRGKIPFKYSNCNSNLTTRKKARIGFAGMFWHVSLAKLYNVIQNP